MTKNALLQRIKALVAECATEHPAISTSLRVLATYHESGEGLIHTEMSIQMQKQLEDYQVKVAALQKATTPEDYAKLIAEAIADSQPPSKANPNSNSLPIVVLASSLTPNPAPTHGQN